MNWKDMLVEQMDIRFSEIVRKTRIVLRIYFHILYVKMPTIIYDHQKIDHFGLAIICLLKYA